MSMSDNEKTVRELYPEQADTLLDRIDMVDGLKIRAMNCCVNAGIHHAYQLLGLCPNDLLNMKYPDGRIFFGKKTVAELDAWMRELGCPMRPNTVEPEA